MTKSQPKPWIGIDGEGWDVDQHGRQCYKLIAAASDEGFSDALYCPPGQNRLYTEQLLEWLCFVPFRYGRWRQANHLKVVRPRLCGFGLGYDYAHILLDLSLEQLRALFHNQDPDSPWIEYRKEVMPSVVDSPTEGAEPDVTTLGRTSAPSYLLKLTAGRLQIKRRHRGQQMGFANLWDTFRYFQTAFVKAADAVMTPHERELIAAGKARRGEAEHNLETETAYAVSECRILARLMATLEEQTRSLELYPNSWYGPGSLATLALKKENVGSSYRPDSELHPELVSAAAKAFIGGRFETTGHGRLPHLFEYDIKSAYPHAITRLPCLAHTRWRHVTAPTLQQVLDAPWALVHTAWKIPSPAGGWGPWPSRVQPQGDESNAQAVETDHRRDPKEQRRSSRLHRHLEGRGDGQLGKKPLDRRSDQSQPQNGGAQPGSDSALRDPLLDGQPRTYLPVWPWSGRAHLWGPEFRAGLDLLRRSAGWQVHLDEAWIPIVGCDCRPFEWVEEWYRERQALLAAGDPKEKWIKLILNSLYGKMAQQVGRPQWHSWLWSGMITAHCRAQLLQAVAQDPEAVVMTATDAVYSVRPLNLAIGEQLGEWESKSLSQLLIVQSGFFKAHQTLAASKPRTRGIPQRFIEWPRFEAAWDEIRVGRQWDEVKITVDRDVVAGEPFQIHVGIGLAQLWGKPEKLGAWIDYPTEVTFVTDKRPLLWPAGPKRGDWLSTRPWSLPANEGTEYRPGRGIGEDRFLVADQPNASEWGEL